MANTTQSGMSYEELNETLKSFDAVDSEIYRIHSFLNSYGKCTVRCEDMFIYVEQTSPAFYAMTLID